MITTLQLGNLNLDLNLRTFWNISLLFYHSFMVLIFKSNQIQSHLPTSEFSKVLGNLGSMKQAKVQTWGKIFRLFPENFKFFILFSSNNFLVRKSFLCFLHVANSSKQYRDFQTIRVYRIYFRRADYQLTPNMIKRKWCNKICLLLFFVFEKND